jgi:phosphate transport system substrate-binding protein
MRRLPSVPIRPVRSPVVETDGGGQHVIAGANLSRFQSVAVKIALGALSLALLAACDGGGGKKGAAKTGVFTVIVDGSSTVFPISEAAAEAFQDVQKGRVRVTVAESGTGGGFRKFCRGETHIQGASRPILASEMQACAAAGVEFIEIPIAFDALTVVVHPESPVISISSAELKKAWEPAAEGKIVNWKQINPAFPDLPLKLYGAGTASGTFDYFTEAVVGKAKSSRTDYTPTEDDNVTVQGVTGDRGAMGYFGMAYLKGNAARVRPLAISHEGGAPVLPSVEAVLSGSYKPLARPIFIYVNADVLERAPVRMFVDYFVAGGGGFATKVGYVPLPAQAYGELDRRVASRQIGTAFGGEQSVGATIDEILARPLIVAPQP